VSNLLRLLDLPDEALALIETGDLSEGHGRALLLADDHGYRRRLARDAAEHGWSVRDLEARARVPEEPRVSRLRAPSTHPDVTAALARVSDAFGDALGTDAKASASRSGGCRVQLAFDSVEEALELAERLGAASRPV
jgi:ParB family chromosome partitioning protein